MSDFRRRKSDPASGWGGGFTGGEWPVLAMVIEMIGLVAAFGALFHELNDLIPPSVSEAKRAILISCALALVATIAALVGLWLHRRKHGHWALICWAVAGMSLGLIGVVALA